MVNIAVMGYGTVGSGVIEVLQTNKERIDQRAGDEIHVKYILDLREFPGDPHEAQIVHDFEIIEKDEDVEIVVEAMGGVNPAYKFAKACLLAGKHVVTSNKELVAKHGPELLQIAREHNCNYLFEASVGGGIPIIRPLNYSLTAEKIEAINGILNGTTNYILTKMSQEGSSYEDVLKEAQDLGYAERNPEADVEGYDACRKIAILSSLMFSKNVDSEKVPTEGITKITAADFEYANATDHTIKLLGRSRAIDDNTAEVMVAPFLLSKEHPLAMVHGVFNAVFVTGNMLGDSMYYGRGAGKLPTASAVVSDVIDCARHQGKVIMCFWDKEEVKLADIGEAERSFFIRAKAGAEDAVTAAFPGGRVVHLKDRKEDFGYFTQSMKEKDFQAKYEALGEHMLGRIRLV